MTTFKGFGPGKPGGWTKKRYDRHGNEVGESAPKKRTASLHTRFKPFWTPQVTKAAAAKAGAHVDKEYGGAHFTSERQLRKYQANEAALGRETHWKQH